jgi:AcrR family transcriptional regulator
MSYPPKLNRERILSEAARLVDEQGLDALSTRVLARRLGVRASSLYRYFPDKASLVRAVSTMFLTELAGLVNQHTTLAQMAHAYWEYGARYPNRYAVVVCRAPVAEQPLVDAKFQVTEPLVALATRLAPERALVVKRALWSYLHGAVSLQLAWPTRPGLDPEEAFVAGLVAFEQWLTPEQEDTLSISPFSEELGDAFVPDLSDA